jgi:hypothetical protein
MKRIQGIFLSLIMFCAVCTYPPKVEAVTLTWTCVGDDGNEGTADHYILIGSTDRSSLEADFWGCSPEFCVEVAGMPAPLPAGTTQSYEFPPDAINLFPSGATVYFRLVAVDEAGNAGIPSNTAIKEWPDNIAPAQIIDLR